MVSLRMCVVVDVWAVVVALSTSSSSIPTVSCVLDVHASSQGSWHVLSDRLTFTSHHSVTCVLNLMC